LAGFADGGCCWAVPERASGEVKRMDLFLSGSAGEGGEEVEPAKIAATVVKRRSPRASMTRAHGGRPDQPRSAACST